MLALLNLRLRADYARDFTGAVAIAALSFNTDNLNGKSNESDLEISRIVLDFHGDVGLPIYPQWEDERILRVWGIEDLNPYPERQGQHISTHIYLRWLAKQLGKGARVIIICHPDHAWRVSVIAEFYGLVPLVPALCERVPYDPLGGQWWVRSRPVYVAWDYIAGRLGFILVGWWWAALTDPPDIKRISAL